MMYRALFLDQSTTACGYSIALFDEQWRFTDIERSGVLYPPKKDDGVDRITWIMEQASELLRTEKPCEVVIEDTRFSGGRTHGNRDTDELLGALTFAIRLTCRQINIPFYRQGTSTIKCYGAGNGKASKADMVIAASAILGREARDDNEADAVLAAVSWGKRRAFILDKQKKGGKGGRKR